MTNLPDHLAKQYLDALGAGVRAVTQIEAMIRQLEYLRTIQLASLSRVTIQIARDEQHPDHGAHLHRAVEAEIATATRTTHSLASARLAHAAPLVRDYPAVTAVFGEGRISLRHTEIITDAGQIISTSAARAAFELEVLPLAVTMTPTQLRAHARRLAEHFADRTIDERHAEARTRRSVRVTALDDGMAQLVAVLGAAEAYAIKDRVARLAREALRPENTLGSQAASDSSSNVNNAADSDNSTADSNAASTSALTASDTAAESAGSRRTRFQTQADVFVQLLLADHNGCSSTGSNTQPNAPNRDADQTLPIKLLQQITGHIQVAVPVFTLADIRTSETAPFAGPAELAGYGPIDSDTARRLSGNAPGWDRILMHPVTGTVLAVDRYRPGNKLKRYLQARDQHCRFPGCIRPAISCDIDHTVPALHGGATSCENTGHLCRAHHTLKHATFLGGRGWSPTQTRGGIYQWTSLTGNTYQTTPTSTVRFKPVQIQEAIQEAKLMSVESETAEPP